VIYRPKKTAPLVCWRHKLEHEQFVTIFLEIPTHNFRNEAVTIEYAELENTRFNGQNYSSNDSNSVWEMGGILLCYSLENHNVLCEDDNRSKNNQYKPRYSFISWGSKFSKAIWELMFKVKVLEFCRVNRGDNALIIAWAVPWRKFFWFQERVR